MTGAAALLAIGGAAVGERAASPDARAQMQHIVVNTIVEILDTALSLADWGWAIPAPSPPG